MQSNQNIIAIYSRKSRFTGKGESIGNQVDLCRSYIRTAYGNESAGAAIVFEDEGFSGGNLNRPDFRRMMQAAREHRFRAVVVYRLDRISRNISDFSALIQELGRLGIDFISIRESFDTSSPMGRAMMYIASVFSQLERETIAERIRDNMHELAKTGRWLGGITPTGYASEAVRRVTVDGKSKRVCQLKLLPEEADVVRRIYELYRETGSLTGTEAALLRERVQTKNGRGFTRFSIKAILQNPVYVIADGDAYRYFVEKQADVCSDLEEFDGMRGILAYHRTEQEKGRTTQYLPTNQWIVAVGRHPGLIPAGMWIGVQESLERNRSRSYRKPRSNEALLTGLLWCRCGGRMHPKLSGRVTGEGRPAHVYVCKQKERSKGGLCSERNINGNQLDQAVLEQLEHLPGDMEALLARLEKGVRSAVARGKEEEPLEALRRQRREIQRRIDALVDTLEGFTDSDAVVHVRKRIEELHSRDAALQERIRALETQETRRELCGEEREALSRRLATFSGSAVGMSVEEKRAVLRAVVDKVVWDGQCAHVVLSGAEDQARWCEDSK